MCKIRGINDQEIQLALLGDQNQSMTLEQVFRFVEAKESVTMIINKMLSHVPGVSTNIVNGCSVDKESVLI